MKTPIGCLAAAVLLAQSSQPLIDNEQVRVLKVVDTPHHKGSLHKHDSNRVMVYLQPGTEDLHYQEGQTTHLSWKAGEAKWSPAGGMHVSELTSDQPVTIIEIELKKPGGTGVALLDPLDPVKVDPGITLWCGRTSKCGFCI